MSYLIQGQIGGNNSMFSRVAQCAAQQGIANPDDWTNLNRRVWAASPGWDDAWASALASHPPTEGGGQNPPPPYDPGADEAVITDQMILSEVQALLAGRSVGS